ncbi:glycine/betaine ABC transporter permease [Salimicrobium jeotgali]|uniref:Glycine/betaine ABC transporter permease n=1 Tax=Salimicrobium jeotgali TaxID=1230341 RepID=K2GCI2_9BACI|nr:ABC transporter permease/substrate-binding protein [Salimicrobium jeotgali]AKG04489.1 glycine/betaine ABC transporter permease [Salimicrobium jeotgali]EKE32698.1 osmoprotectant ABC transporter permease/substrate-binding protein [Salimicrobium jeotgali]MBM7695316.1 osmoprotectant transport system permease protein [Salimicrobium jeotgali]
MNEFIDIFQQRQDEFWIKLWEHLQISIISLIIATLIAVPLGLILTRYKRTAEPIIQVTAILQTIPSLAVLAFLIPFFGIGQTPAIIALIAYGLLPILRNTYTGVSEVDNSLLEAATGMGMNSFKRLSKVELPLAMPVIMAGIRTSMVLIVGTTTIAALIGAGGLGDLILLGLDRGGDINLILLGAIPAALLAILLDVVLRFFERTSAKTGMKSLFILIIVALLIVVAPIIFTGKAGNDITIGAKLNAEPTILINMYELLIEEETDLEVGLEPNLGKTDLVFSALQEGSIDIYPEFTGTALVSLLDRQPDSYESKEVYQQAKQGMAEEYDMAYLEPMKYNNTYTVATTKEYAQENNLETIGDLAPIDDEVTAGFTLEFNDREDGYQGMKELYNLEFGEVKTMDPGLRQGAIKNGEVDIIDAYATDSYMVELNLTTLDDPKNLFPPYQGAPLMRQETLEKYPELEDVLNKLGGKITEDQMREMNYEVDVKDRAPSEVARDYLVEEGLLDK